MIGNACKKECEHSELHSGIYKKCISNRLIDFNAKNSKIEEKKSFDEGIQTKILIVHGLYRHE